MNKVQEFSPSQESEFEVVLSEEDYQRLTNAGNLYKASLETNRILAQEFEQFKRRTLDRDRDVEQLIRRVLKMGKRMMNLEQEIASKSQRCQKLQIELNQVLLKNKELKQEDRKIQEINIEKRASLQQSKIRIQIPSIKIEEWREKASKYQELKKENQEKINRLERQLQTQITAKQNMMQNQRSSCEQKRHYSDFMARLSVQIRRLNSIVQTTQEEQEKTQGIDALYKSKPNESTYNESQQSQKVNESQDLIKSQLKTNQKVLQKIMIIESSELQFIEESLTTITRALSSHSSLLKKFKELQQLNSQLETSKQALCKRIQAIQVYCSNLKQKMSTQLNIATILENKYDEMKTTLDNQFIQNAMEDLISKYRQTIDNEYAKIVQRLINE